ncbi:LPS export ABC transporter permease LptG [Alkalilimnicola sp. S0819]|uniref:LPS export ABC transporter permease LptG n=1 Tax=Alkalilimnicola sp. S0819 TaxID=2613922 RepID=UPI0012615FC9|nr:LPS export ABC transporter permease LptG [Alkalilimnicola sp. S0819]KAB7628340.1 LPS export ABC transporter permease LptG [Alkalilimnicola sp. S0819]MPQ15239.1 LPS export ABC transporter permease LptG [Alkalilimnicola sp. S0819]
MSIFARYLIRTVIAGSLIALLVIISLELVFAFVDQSQDVGEQDYTALTALLYVLLTAPYRAYEAFPMATLIGSLVGLGGLAARSELVVMRAAGVSVLGVARAVMAAGLLLALLAMALGEWVAPVSERWAQELRARAMAEKISARASGFWARDGRFYVEVERADSARLLRGVRLYQFDGADLQRVITADTATHTGRGWQLDQARQTVFGPQGVAVGPVKALSWDSQLEPEVLDVVVVEPEALPLRQLHTYIGYLRDNGLESERYQLAFWIKLATPLATITMLLLTVPLVFGSLRTVGAGQRIFIGVLIGIGFFLANRLLNHAGLVYGLPPVLSALLPTGLFLLAGVWATARVR